MAIETIMQNAVEKIHNGYKGFYKHSIIILRKDIYEALGTPERLNGMKVKMTDDKNAPEIILA